MKKRSESLSQYDWFDLKQYQIISDFSPFEWLEQIAYRRLLFLNAKHGECNNGFESLSFLKPYYNELKDYPYIEMDFNEIVSNQEFICAVENDIPVDFDPNVFIALNTFEATKLLSLNDVFDRLADSLNKKEKSFLSMLLDDSIDTKTVNEAPCNLSGELDKVFEPDRFNKAGAWFEVDLNKSDNEILDNLKLKLKTSRRLIGQEKPPKRRSPPYDSWRTSRTIEYIDLQIYSMFFLGESIDNSLAYSLLFPNGEREETSFFKLTKSNSEDFMSVGISKLLLKICDHLDS